MYSLIVIDLFLILGVIFGAKIDKSKTVHVQRFNRSKIENTEYNGDPQVIVEDDTAKAEEKGSTSKLVEDNDDVKEGTTRNLATD